MLTGLTGLRDLAAETGEPRADGAAQQSLPARQPEARPAHRLRDGARRRPARPAGDLGRARVRRAVRDRRARGGVLGPCGRARGARGRCRRRAWAARLAERGGVRSSPRACSSEGAAGGAPRPPRPTGRELGIALAAAALAATGSRALRSSRRTFLRGALSLGALAGARAEPGILALFGVAGAGRDRRLRPGGTILARMRAEAMLAKLA